MLFLIIINFKAHKVKIQEIKGKKKKFIKQKGKYIIYIDRNNKTTKETTR